MTSADMGERRMSRTRRPFFDDVSGADIGLLVLRLSLGIIYLGHGLQKLGWFEGGGYPTSIATQEQFLKFFGYSNTHFLAWVILITELVAGLSLLIGFLTPLGAAAAMGISWQFIAGAQWSAGLFGNTSGAGGYENSLVFLVAALSLAFVGPGRISIDYLLRWKLAGVRWGLVALVAAVGVGTFVLVVWGVGLGGTPPPPPTP